MFHDLIKYDEKLFPDTGYVAHLFLESFSGYKWLLDFFYWVRNEIDDGNLSNLEVFLKFKELISNSLAKGFMEVNIEKVDWIALFNFIEESTRPKGDNPLFSSTIIHMTREGKEKSTREP